MSPELWELIQDWVEAKTAEKIEQAFGRDSGQEWLRAYQLEKAIKDHLSE